MEDFIFVIIGFVVCIIGGVVSCLGFEFHWWSLIAENLFQAFVYGFFITFGVLIGAPVLVAGACS